MDRSRKLATMGGGSFSTASMVGLFLGLAEMLLVVRVFLKFFFTISGNAGFVHWAFATTDALLSPLRGVFVDPTLAHTRWYVDFPALFAMAAYAAVGALLIALASDWRAVSRVKK